MVITSDILLKGSAWHKAIENLTPIFKSKTNYMIYMLSVGIGIMYDKRIAELDTTEEDEIHAVPRNVIRNQDNGHLEMMYQTAILTTKTEELSEEERLTRAFDDQYDDKEKLNLLLQFANFGVVKLVEQIGDTTLETMSNISDFLNGSIEGDNLNLDPITEDILLTE